MIEGAVHTFANCGFPWRCFAAAGLAFGAALGIAPAQAQSNPCAIYGSGFVSVHGGDTCVRIGGRVRLDAGAVPPPSGPEGSLRFAPTPAPLDGPARAHLRLQGGGSQSGMPRTR